MLDYAVEVCKYSHEINSKDHKTLLKLGFSEDDIWDIGAISALFALSNRLANMAEIRPNDEFYLLGRIERAE